VRFVLERAAGGTSVVGLARVSWVGSDPEAQAGTSTSIMRLRFLSLSDASHRLINTWLDEVSAVAQRPQLGDDSAVRALGRAIADSLAPPPPQMPGAPPKRGPSIPTPPGYPSLMPGGLPRVRNTTPSGLMVGPLNPEALAGDGSTSGVTALGTTPTTPAEARSRQLRKRRSKLPTMRGGLTASLAPPAPVAPLAPVELAPPLPLGALLHAPPAQTRRSSPPPADPSLTSEAQLPASSAAVVEALPPPPPVPVIEPLPEPVPATPRVSSSAPPPAERASLPLGGPSLPPDVAPWVPRPAKRRWDARFAT
jgi:hypothetical protein